ncbi:MAG: formylglycine-generating enzyme family protein [Gammaproteobacteria bacterium]|nr:formylglycine-generating enzyme family protein [Gammaproteobacteria bacterium]
MNVTPHYRWHPLANGIPPAWASGWGEDDYGVWVTITISDVTQTLRWIAPGSFVMGSPGDEPGRLTPEELKEYNLNSEGKHNLKPEGPQHQVRLTEGYWLFDAPVTQALYQAVTGENPSEFKSAQRPVDSVSWEDAMQFIQTINDLHPGLNLSLPSEAQWEYACRAGTATATYAGAIEILGENNAPILDTIAWYGGNSGKDFDLEQGYDSTDWPEKHYPHTKAGTRIVAQKHPNPWGLYDMLGNVWEWCLDGQREYTEDPQSDPLGSTEDGTGRVLRGGSWLAHARHVRCAYRFAYLPGYANDAPGFRCARVQEPGQVS